MLRKAWHIGAWCTRQTARLLLWSVWALLLLALAAQVYVVSHRSLALPDPLRRLVNERLASEGLQVDYRDGEIDLAGRVVLRDVRVAFVTASAEPVATADVVYLHLDPRDLVLGKLDLLDLSVHGLDIPGLASGVEAAAIPLGDEIELSWLTGYVLGVPAQVDGRFRVPRMASSPAARRPRAFETVAAVRARLDGLAASARPWIAAAGSPRLRIHLGGGRADIDLSADSLDLGAVPGGPGGRLSGLRATTTVPLGAPPARLAVRASAAAADLPGEISAREAALLLRVEGSLRAGVLDLQAGSVRWRDVETGPVVVAAAAAAPGAVSAEVSLALAGGDWSARASADLVARSGRAVLDGFVDDGALAFAGSLIGKDLSGLLDPVQAAPLHAEATFAPGWKLARASGRLHSGVVRVGTVMLDETGTEFDYDGRRVLCDALVLRLGDSLAHGSYEMDTATNDFRFLLSGRLRPAGIAGWFHEWWTNFWDDFDFAGGPPDASVDVRGRWGDLTATNVYVQAKGAGAGLRGVPFDRVETRLFLRPHWFDILRFDVAKDAAAAGGRVARSLDATGNGWRHMEFGVESTLPLATIAKLFPAESASLLAPYTFETPPRLKIEGRVDSAGSPAGKHESINVDVVSTGPMTFHDFPLSDLRTLALVRDDVVELPRIDVMFAGGRATGHARLQGEGDARRLSFDVSLSEADLGAVVQAVSALQPPPATPPTAKAAEAAKRRQQRLEGGRLDFVLKAEGPFNDPHGFTGKGRGSITNAELGQLNLFGPISEALRGTFLNFSSFSLNTVEAPFKLDGERVRFPDLRVSGPSALILAKGDYHLDGGSLDFTARIHPFDENSSMFGSAASLVLSPFSRVFEVKLKGTLADPSWVFSYGPSRLLNTLTGGERQTTPAPPSSTASP